MCEYEMVLAIGFACVGGISFLCAVVYSKGKKMIAEFEKIMRYALDEMPIRESEQLDLFGGTE